MEHGTRKKCGKELKEDSKFCENCGAKNDDEQKISEYASRSAGKKEKSSNKFILTWIMVLLSFIVVAVMVVFAVKTLHKDGSDTNVIRNYEETGSKVTVSEDKEAESHSTTSEEKEDDNAAKQLVENLSELKDSKEGDIIEFGNYYGNTEWIVLKREGDILTLLSKDCINQKPYNTEYEDVTWETCSLRKWLNEEYINEAFDGIEQQLIEETTIQNADNSECETEGGHDTKDKIFLLSLEEAEELFTDEDSRTAEYFGDTKGCWWWLRSPGAFSYCAATVGSFGTVNCIGLDVDHECGAIRPAFQLNLSNLTNLELKSNLIGTNRKQRDVNQELVKIQNASVGEWVEYGSYLGTTTWIVLKKEEGKALLLAKDAVRYGPYNNEYEYEDNTWENCSLRTWLNDTYLNCAFNEEEREQIEKTDVKNVDNPENGTEGGADTEDRVFLLSIEEVEEYFNNDESRQATNTDGEDCWWWLRSPGITTGLAVGVNSDGSVSYGGTLVDNSYGAVRPALWVNLD